MPGIYIIRSRYTKIWKIFKIFSKNFRHATQKPKTVRKFVKF
ncbi:hypothetical protein HMPREF9193_02190 [Treponema lecithinolyticum ATCC 700332]|uniref:Uncharacterized protein n=1 Tax=Treponema lecithinolyticum ATCC 700332 TaxID=1321815 RepID=A0ABN0NW12_TRELE|nr:hypothetical protein HMPREF9193_02190 [Treponema lecithinolyticum ATCC 700332]